MSSNYLFTANAFPVSIHGQANFNGGGSGASVSEFVQNGANSLITQLAGNNLSVYRHDPDTLTGDNLSNTFSVAVGSAVTASKILLNGDGSNGYIFVARSNEIRFFRGINLNTQSTTLTTQDATFTVVGSPSKISAHVVSSTEAYLAAVWSNQLGFFRFNPTTVSGTVSATTASFTGGGISAYNRGTVEWDGANTIGIASSQNDSTTAAVVWRFDPATVSGSVSTATATLTRPDSLQSRNLESVRIGSTVYCWLQQDGVGGTTPIYYYNFTNSSVSGANASVNNIAVTGQGALNLVAANINSEPYLLARVGSYLGVAHHNLLFKFVGISNPTPIVAPFIDFGTFNTGFAPGLGESSAGNALIYLPLVGSTRRLHLLRTDLNSRESVINLSEARIVGANAPLRKTSTTPITLFSSVSYFLLDLFARIGSQLTHSGITALRYQYLYAATSDSTGTFSEDFALDGTSDITGNYRVTIAGANLILGSKTLYSSSFTLDGDSTLVLNQSVELTDDFVLSAGTTVNRTGTGAVTLTIPYPDPGLVLGTGVTLLAPSLSVTVAGFQPVSNVRISYAGQTLAILNDTSPPFVYSVDNALALPATVTLVITKVGFETYTQGIQIVDSNVNVTVAQVPEGSSDTYSSPQVEFQSLMIEDAGFLRVLAGATAGLADEVKAVRLANFTDAAVQAAWALLVAQTVPTSGEITVWQGYLVATGYSAISFNSSTGVVS